MQRSASPQNRVVREDEVGLGRIASVLRAAASSGILGLALCAAARGQQWTQPTAEELKMTTYAQAPGAPAIYLDKSVVVEDWMNQTDVSVRIKVLTEKGKDYANVELSYEDYFGSPYEKVAGRTIHPDGTVIPFTGKPYEKLVLKANHYQEKALVFTLPSVEIGSILEYRYTVHESGPPSWYFQDELYTRHAHYAWGPTTHEFYVYNKGFMPGRVAWTATLPPGVAVNQTTSGMNGPQMEIDIRDLPPLVSEEEMPPIKSLSYRILFYDTPYGSVEEYWKGAGDWWSKGLDKFLEANRSLKEDVQKIVSPGDTDEEKARKLYDFVMTLENTSFTRERTAREDKSQGFRDVKDADDVLKRKRGSAEGLTLLYIAMARAAGLKAYAMGVADRETRLWVDSYMSLNQIDDVLAIVVIDGKEVYFDPGERYCEPEHLAWKHMLTGGLRQTEHGTELARTPAEPYESAHISRIADLKLDETGSAEGIVTLTYTGAAALKWRQLALLGDEASVKTELRTELESALPAGMDVEVAHVENLTDYEKPLKASFKVKGTVASSTGKRLLVPADCFEASAKPRFTAAKRDVGIDLEYAAYRQDAVRYSFAPGLMVESSPEPATKLMPALASYAFHAQAGKNSVTSYRDLAIATALILPKKYPEFHSFYATVQSKDQETIVLTRAAAGTSAAKDGTN